MNKGVVLFAHNNRTIDYALLSVISGSLAKQYLNVPVSLITDSSTVEWMKQSDTYNTAQSLFDHIILTERPVTNNIRNIHNGPAKETVPFNNNNRHNVWDLTPYDRTLLIDTDYFIQSDLLNNYWDLDSDFLIADSMKDVVGENREGYLDKYVSETGVKMYWATTIMFTKNEKTKVLFDLVDYIKENYSVFADTYRFNPSMYRNDIAFSIAKHILDGFETAKSYNLPPIKTITDKDIFIDRNKNGDLIFLVSDLFNEEFYPCTIKNEDIHIMNKQSVTKNADKFMEKL